MAVCGRIHNKNLKCASSVLFPAAPRKILHKKMHYKFFIVYPANYAATLGIKNYYRHHYHKLD